MMSYSELSDFEINKRVATFIFPESEVQSAENMWPCDSDSAVQVIHKLGVHGEYVDYCNNPLDAWPIIVANKIASVPYGGDPSMAYPVEHGMASKYCCKDNNPLRAAMVVYLMMQEQQHDR